MMMRAMIVGVVLLLMAGCAQHGVEVRQEDLVVPLNSAVHWDGDFFGLVAELKAGNDIRRAGPAARDALLRALADPDRFVASHVLLTQMSGNNFGMNESEWNGLHVTLHADGRATWDAGDQPHLRQRWEWYFQGSGTLRVLGR